MLDILMITHNRLEYLKKALPSVLKQTLNEFHLTIIDNASDEETLIWLRALKARRLQNVSVVFNQTNDSLADVTTRFFLRSRQEFVGKVDSDTIVPPDWAARLIDAHRKHHLGFIGGFHFRQEDLIGRTPIIEDFSGVKLWCKHHIGGCSFIIRREDFKGYRGDGVMGLSEYQAEMGLPNGYLWEPILWVDHMEDPRSEHYIGTEEYNQYKLKTRGISLARYAQSISNPAYLNENTRNV